MGWPIISENFHFWDTLLEGDSNLRPSGRKAPNLPLSHHDKVCHNFVLLLKTILTKMHKIHAVIFDDVLEDHLKQVSLDEVNSLIQNTEELVEFGGMAETC